MRTLPALAPLLALLAACTPFSVVPVQNVAAGASNAVTGRGTATVFSSERIQGTPTVDFGVQNAVPLVEFSVTIQGTNAAMADRRLVRDPDAPRQPDDFSRPCYALPSLPGDPPNKRWIGCEFGPLPANSGFSFKVVGDPGTVAATASFREPGDVLPRQLIAVPK